MTILGPIIVCSTDTASCNCGAPVSTPSGMHPDDCPTNPASRLTDEQRAWIARRPNESTGEWVNRMRQSKGLEPIAWEDER